MGKGNVEDSVAVLATDQRMQVRGLTKQRKAQKRCRKMMKRMPTTTLMPVPPAQSDGASGTESGISRSFGHQLLLLLAAPSC
mmetsp:Transcript_1469/g.3470  ORF Transcript_1469/g.3470 Transcript_1469/m.3470 type:complete len:82 (+) Transcript_1469:1227-1472(+)